jgi:hypothetical protein
MRSSLSALVLGISLVTAPGAHAATIDYIFNGTGTGSLNGSAFSGDFNVTYVGDTTAVQSAAFYNTNAAVGTFTFGSTLAATLNNPANIVLINDPAAPGAANIGFAQSQPSPVFGVNEALYSPTFVGYNGATAFPLTTGTANAIEQTYLTNVGALTFTTITALNFEATTPGATSATPLPAALPLFAAALLGLGALGFRRNRAN